MAKLEVLENKKLVLKNVISYELRDIELDSLDEEINNFLNKLDVLNVQTFGPLVSKNFGTNISEAGELTSSYDLMIQAHNYKQFSNIYKTHDKVTAEYCLYVRFSDHPQYMQYAHNKLDLHFYENDIIPSDETYTIIVSETENHLTIDIFRPVKRL